MFRTEEGWQTYFEEVGAHSKHDKNPARPHAETTAGLHTEKIYNFRIIVQRHPEIVREVAHDLVELFVRAHGNIEVVDRVVGPQTGATFLAECISDEIGKRRGRPCDWASPRHIKKGQSSSPMIFDDREHFVLPEEIVLMCEDVVSTGGSVGLACEAVLKCGANILSTVLTVVNRSNFLHLSAEGYVLSPILALITVHIPLWTSDECPLCKLGSKAIRPKGEEAWKRLTATY